MTADGAPLTIGIEEEYLVVDTSDGRLVPRSPEAVDAALDVLGDAVCPELNRCQIEVATPVCTGMDELGDSLRHLRSGLAQACRPLGLAPLASGTHPFSHWQDQEIHASDDRYERMEERYQMLARQQVICGMHVHVAVADPTLRIAVMNRVRSWLPLLLALSANSPFWQGDDSGYASYRTQVWQRWPTAGMPPTLDGPDDYDRLVDQMVRSGAIEDATHLYWYARPSARYPTLEFRVCDVCPEPADAVVLAGLLRALVWVASTEPVDRADEPADRFLLRHALWRASRYGLEDDLNDPLTGEPGPAAEVIRRSVARLHRGLDAHGDRSVVEAGVDRILARGNGARRQRERMATLGPQGLVAWMVERTAGADVAGRPGA